MAWKRLLPNKRKIVKFVLKPTITTRSLTSFSGFAVSIKYIIYPCTKEVGFLLLILVLLCFVVLSAFVGILCGSDTLDMLFYGQKMHMN